MYDAGQALTGSRWGRVSMPQSSVPVTNLAPHVTGDADSGSAGANGTASGSESATLNWAAGIVIVAIVALWFLGYVVFRSARV